VEGVTPVANRYSGKRVIVQKGAGRVRSRDGTRETAGASFRAMEISMHSGHLLYRQRGN